MRLSRSFGSATAKASWAPFKAGGGEWVDPEDCWPAARAPATYLRAFGPYLKERPSFEVLDVRDWFL